METFDVVVIGGGTAGLVTASGCARLGRKVALIEKAALGGDCLWTGCVPTKALVATAKLVHQARHADAFGLDPVTMTVAPQRILDSMRETQRVAAKHDDPAKFRALGIDVIEGTARFTGPREVIVNNRRITASDVVIATGSRTAVPPIPGLAEAGFLDHVSFLRQNSIPKSVAILGGGYIGIEFAQIFRRFGSAVTVVEMTSDIIVREDAEVIAGVRALLVAEGIDIRTGSKVVKVSSSGHRKILHTEAGSIEADEIFVAAGRRGNIENLGLDNAGVQTNRSFITVDKYLRTSVPHIWACGDVHGGLQFTHVAAYEAVKLVRNILFPGKSAVNYDDVPWALYTDPEVGHIGLTESEARHQFGDDDVRVYRVDMSDVDRAVVDRTSKGFLKIITDQKGRILGAHAFCSAASTLIHQLVLARQKGIRLGDLAQVVSPYPSLADAIGKIGTQYFQGIGRSWLGSVARRVASFTQ